MRSEMRTGVWDGRITWLKRCVACGEELPADRERPELSAFGSAKRHPDGTVRVFNPRCRVCYRALSRERARRNRLDPQQRERLARATRAWRLRKIAADPDYFRDTERLWRRMRAEREGRTLRRSSAQVRSGLPVCALEPFREWICAYMLKRGFVDARPAAIDLGIEERRVRGVLNRDSANVALDIVDRALLNARGEVEVRGRLIFGLDDLYPSQQVAA